jgi:hypothetical protein
MVVAWLVTLPAAALVGALRLGDAQQQVAHPVASLGRVTRSIVDVWAQPPTERFLAQPWLASLERWRGESFTVVPLEQTVAAMEAGGVEIALLSGWHGPTGSLISNDEVAAAIAAYPDRFAGLATVDLSDPMGRPRDPSMCQRAQRIRRRSGRALAVEPATERLPLLPGLRRLCGARATSLYLSGNARRVFKLKG